MELKTVGELKELIMNLPDDFEIKFKVVRGLSECELACMAYPYPIDSEESVLELDDIGYSDKVVCLSAQIDNN